MVESFSGPILGRPFIGDGTVLILFAHGTRDPEGTRELQALRERVAEISVWPVGLGVLEFPSPELPDFQQVLTSWSWTGARRFVVVPLLLFPANHLQQDLPRQLKLAQERFPSIEIEATPPIGTHPVILEIVLDRLAETLRQVRRDPRSRTALLLVGRGSTVAAANCHLNGVARQIQERSGLAWVEAAFVSLTQPGVAEGLVLCRQHQAEAIVVLPYFLNAGLLIQRIQSIVTEHPCHQTIIVGRHLGLDPRLIEAIVETAQCSGSVV